MNKIRIERITNCSICSSEGMLIQDSISDPDFQIEGLWNEKICVNPQCQTVWLDPRPIKEDLIKAYETYHTHTPNSEMSNLFSKLLLSFSKRLIKVFMTPIWMIVGIKSESEKVRYMDSKNNVGRLVDVGCGGGRFLIRMKKRGWNVEGVDLDPKVAEKVKNKYGINVHIGDIIDCNLEKSSYDLVTLNQTIEHLYDPKKSLQECYIILKTGGKIVITTPNPTSLSAGYFRKDWRGWEPPRHLYLFNPTAINKILTDVGFRIENISTTSCDSATGYYTSKINSKILNHEKVKTFHRLQILFWSYKMELNEFLQKRKDKNIGQGVIASAIKI